MSSQERSGFSELRAMVQASVPSIEAVPAGTRYARLGLFGADVGYLPVTRWQRLRHVQPQRFALWHSLHQLNKTLPPAGCGPRVVTVHDLNYLYGRNAFSTWRHHRRTAARGT